MCNYVDGTKDGNIEGRAFGTGVLRLTRFEKVVYFDYAHSLCCF